MVGLMKKKKQYCNKKMFSFISVYIASYKKLAAKLDYMPNKLVFKINVCRLK